MRDEVPDEVPSEADNVKSSAICGKGLVKFEAKSLVSIPITNSLDSAYTETILTREKG